MIKKYCIIGTSAAGIAAAQKLRQLDPQASIICFSDEVDTPYNKCMLADYASGIKNESQVYTLSRDQAEKKNIQLMLGKKVTVIDFNQKIVTLEDRQQFLYDALLIGAGTSPIVPSIDGVNARGVFAFHRLSDINGIQKYLQENKVQSAVVIGSGLSGLECADALIARAVQVSLVERNSYLLSSLITPQGSRCIADRYAQSGGALHLDRTVKKIVQRDGAVCGIELSDGSYIAASLVVIAVGIQPNFSLVQNSSIAVHDGYGVAVNDQMQTSLPDVYAAGDIVAVKDQLTSDIVASRTWPDAMLQGITAAHAMVGQPKPYPGLASVISSSFFGIKFARLGPIESISSSCTIIEYETAEYYHRFLLEGAILRGFLLVGNVAQVGKFRMAVLTKASMTRASLKPE